MRVVEGVVMPGGWHYHQPLRSGQEQRIEGRTYRELVDRVFMFRLQHIELIPSGTAVRMQVEMDMMDWICSRWPQTCTGFKGELPKYPDPQGKPTYIRPINRIEEWFAKLSQSELKWIDSATAVKRAQICNGCPLNQPWATGCGPCNTNLRQKALLLRGSHKTGYEPQLRACLAYGWMLEVAVWLEEGHAEAIRKPPPECWQRRKEEAMTGAPA